MSDGMKHVHIEEHVVAKDSALYSVFKETIRHGIRMPLYIQNMSYTCILTHNTNITCITTTVKDSASVDKDVCKYFKVKLFRPIDDCKTVSFTIDFSGTLQSVHDEPAATIEYYNITESSQMLWLWKVSTMYCVNGKLHRDDDSPACIETYFRINNNDISSISTVHKFWYNHGNGTRNKDGTRWLARIIDKENNVCTASYESIFCIHSTKGAAKIVTDCNGKYKDVLYAIHGKYIL